MSAPVGRVDIAGERAAVLAEARRWLGTPFHHGARLPGIGVDCAQLLLAVYIGAGVIGATEVPPYAPDWFLHENERRFERWLDVYCIRTDTPAPGDVGLFTYGRCASHGGVLVATGDHARVIHAYRGIGVTEEECGAGSALAARAAGWWTFARWHA